MKKIILLFAICLSGLVNAQSPEGINYQAVAHDNTGSPLNAQNITVRIGILSSSAVGNVEWEETHSVTTNSYGLFSLVVGQGSSTGGGSQGSFGGINWGTNTHFMKVEVDPGTGYENLGTTQLMSVPYAMHANTVTNDAVDDADNDPANELLTGGTLNGTDLELTDAGGTTTIDLSPLSGGGGDDWGTDVVNSDATLSGDGTAGNPLSVVGDLTDDQTLTYTPGTQVLDITGGNSVTLNVDDADASTTNETITATGLTGNVINITEAGTTHNIDLTPVLGSTDTLPIIKNAGNNTYVSALSATEIDMGFTGIQYYIFSDQNRISLPQNGGSIFMGLSPGGGVQSSGSDNIGLGSDALTAVTTGVENLGFGMDALSAVSSGNYNLGIGTNTLGSLSTGNDNIAIGGNAGTDITSGFQNILIGHNAGTTGVPIGQSGNIKIGANSGSGDTGSDKLYIENSGTNTPLIYGNFASDSLKVFGSLSVGNEYTFPLTDGTSGYLMSTDGLGQISFIDPSTIGSTDTLPLIKNAANTFVSALNNADIEMGFANTTYYRFDDQNRLFIPEVGGSFFLGATPGGASQSTGTFNLGLGHASLLSITTGNHNVGAGTNSLQSLQVGEENVALSRDAIKDMANGNDNIGIGGRTLEGMTTGDANVAIGREAGRNVSNGIQNVFIGYRAGVLSVPTAQSGNVKIGSNAGTSDLGSNKLYIENSGSATPLIYGDFANDSLKIHGTLSVGNEFTFPTTDGTAGQILETNGSGQLSWVSSSADSDWTSGAGFIYNNTDRIGVGLNNPDGSSTMHISNSSLANSLLIDNSQTTGNIQAIQNRMSAASTAQKIGVLSEFSNGTGQVLGVSNRLTGNAGSSGQLIGTDNQISIGPAAKKGMRNIISNTGSAFMYGIENDLTTTGSGIVRGLYNTVDGIGTSDVYGVYSDLTSSGRKYGSYARIDQIGTEDLYGFYGEFTNNTGVPTNYGIYMTGETNNYLSGHLGIGTTNPASTLHVETDGTLLGGIRVSDQGSTTTGASIHFDAFSQDWDIYASNSGATAGGDKLLFRNYSAGTDVMAITNSNHVGIGTISPTATLHANGSFRYTNLTEGAGKVLTSDAAGNASWHEKRIAFFSGMEVVGQQGLTQGSASILDFVSESTLFLNDGNDFSPATRDFEAPVNGVYQFNASATFNTTTGSVYQMRIVNSGGTNLAQCNGELNAENTFTHTATLSITVRLLAGERVHVEAINTGADMNMQYNGSSFSGHIVYED